MTATLPGPQVEIEVCLAVGRQASAATWDIATWDANVWAQSDTEMGDWVDVTCSVGAPFEMHAGTDRADGVVTRWEAATTAFTLYGDTFNPRSGPYVGLLGPGLPIRIRWRPAGAAEWRPGFRGYVDDEGFTWNQPHGQVGRARIAATDGTRILNAADLMKRAPVGAGETAAERVARIADAVQWPAADRGILPGGVTVRSTELDGSAWTQLLLVADTDLAHLWVDAAGVLRYVPQGRVSPARDVVASITCEASTPGVPTFPAVSVTGQQPTVVRNVANIQRSVEDGAPAAPVATVTDDQSIERYLRRPYSRTDLVHTDDAYSLTLAQAVLTKGAWPSFAPAAVELSSRIDVEAGYLLLGLEPDITIGVQDDDGSVWICEPTGWSVSIDRGSISGTIGLLDVTAWVSTAEWDAAKWDESKWSFR